MLAGQVVGQLANFCVASHIREGRLAPILPEHMTDHIGLRAFIDLAIEMLLDTPQHVLTRTELQVAGATWARRKTRPSPD
ncbi:MAG: hypothetical protein WAQ08_18340 [Aquabacterium sp.]|uniref:hypothetical protein n=1 Tax=Aquabacterium sp. TaxID=1872578 RepID=UPI003BB084D9